MGRVKTTSERLPERAQPVREHGIRPLSRAMRRDALVWRYVNTGWNHEAALRPRADGELFALRVSVAS